MANFDGTDDFFDSRDVIERIAELESQATNDDGDLDFDILLDSEENEEYQALTALQEEAGGYIADWAYGETFISDDYFTDYAMELLSDLGYLPADLPGWIVIDRDETADNMKADYTSFEFRGTTYWAR